MKNIEVFILTRNRVELLKEISYIRTGGSDEELKCAETLKSVIEECADVYLCLDTVTEKLKINDAVEEIKHYKTLRWVERLNSAQAE